MTYVWFSLVFAGGYVASIYSWPWIRKVANGAAAEAEILRNKAREIEAKIRGN